MKKVFLLVFFSFFIAYSSVSLFNLDNRYNFINSIGKYIDDNFIFSLNYVSNKHDNDVVIIKIDDKTLDSLWRNDIWIINFDKWFYADIIDILINDYNIGVLWIDVILANRSFLWEKDELRLRDAFQKYWDKIVLAARSDHIPHNLCMYNNVQHWIIEVIPDERVRSSYLYYPKYNINDVCWNSWYDTIYENTNWVYNFSVEIFKKYINQQDPLEKNRLSRYFYSYLEDIKNSENILNLNFYHNQEQNSWTLWFRSVSLIDIYNRKNLDFDLNWKIVLIWEVWTLIHDMHFTPISNKARMPWVEIHANIITSFIKWDFLTYINKSIVIFIVFILNLIMLISLFKFNIIINLILIFCSFIWSLLFSTYLYINWYLISFFLLIFWPIFISFTFWYIYKYLIIDKSKRYIKKAFSMYVSKDIVEEISKDPSKLNLEWENKYMSIFFSDIAWFTNISEKMSAKDLFNFLNEYLDSMTKILTNNFWTLDKYIWDAVMWFFNAPLDLENHEYYACKTAIQQQKSLTDLNKKWNNKWLPEIKIRVWIHSWEAMHWNLWSKWERINYTIIWDSVNLAARLESICKYYGVDIIISKNTYEKVKDKFIIRALDKIAVKWKEKPVEIYQLIWFSKNSDKEDEKYNYIKNYQLALSNYYNWEYQKSIEILSNNINDKPSLILSERCRKILNWELHIENWVYIMIEK